MTREAVKRACSLTAALGTGDPTRVAEHEAEGAAFPRDVRGSKNEMRGAGLAARLATRGSRLEIGMRDAARGSRLAGRGSEVGIRDPGFGIRIRLVTSD